MAHKAEAVLEALAAASPAELAGAASLRALHARCLALGMPAVADAASDVQRLHDLFDLALASNLVSVVVHYVLEVCLDPLAVSSEAASAYLMDGEVVAAWASGAFARARADISAALQHGGGGGDASSVALDAAAAALAALRHVAAALASGPGGGSAAARSLCSDLSRWGQYAEALAWLARAAPPLPQHEWQSDWAAAVGQRRKGTAPEITFLERLLSSVAAPAADGAPGAALEYPPRSAAAAARDIFTVGGGGASGGALARSALFCYYLLDAGPPGDAAKPGGGKAGDYATVAGLPAALALEVRAGFLLDAASGKDSPDASAAAAARLLPPGARRDTPLEFVRALAARGLPDAALSLLRCARGGGLRAESAPEALAAVRARLACGLLAEAFCGVAAFTAAEETRAGGAGRDAAATLLVPELAAAAEASGQLGSLAALPLAEAEERALVAWLRGRAQAGATAAETLPAYYLARGRGAEAAAASQLLDAADAAAGGAGSRLPPRAAEHKRALAEARRSHVARHTLPALPAAQRALALAGAALPPAEGETMPVAALEAVAPPNEIAEQTLAAAAGAADAARAPWCLRSLAVGLNPPPLLLPPHQLHPPVAFEKAEGVTRPPQQRGADVALRFALAAEAADAAAAPLPRLTLGGNGGDDDDDDVAMSEENGPPPPPPPPLLSPQPAGAEPPLPRSPFAGGGLGAMAAPPVAAQSPWAAPPLSVPRPQQPAASPAPSLLFAPAAAGDAPQPLLSPAPPSALRRGSATTPSSAALLSPAAGAPLSAFGARRAAREAALAYESGGAPDALLAALGAPDVGGGAGGGAGPRRGAAAQRTLTPLKRPRRATASYAKQ